MREVVRRPGHRHSTTVIFWGEDSATNDGRASWLIAEREDAVRRATLRGASANDLARTLRVSTRSIQRIRARLRARGEL